MKNIRVLQAFKALPLALTLLMPLPVTAQVADRAVRVLEEHSSATPTPAQQSTLDRVLRANESEAWKLVRVTDMSLMEEGARIQFDLPLRPPLYAHVKYVDSTSFVAVLPKGFTWYAELEDDAGSANFVVDSTSVVGTIIIGARLYTVEPIGGDLHVVALQKKRERSPVQEEDFESDVLLDSAGAAELLNGSSMSPPAPDIQGRVESGSGTALSSVAFPTYIGIVAARTPDAAPRVTSLEGFVAWRSGWGRVLPLVGFYQATSTA